MNRNVACVSDLGVEKPVIASSKPDGLRDAMLNRVMAGLLRLKVRIRVEAGKGVGELPPLRPDAVNSIWPAIVPV